MPDEFFHLDQSNAVTQGDVFELSWPPQDGGQITFHATGVDTVGLREQYPEGLSRYGGMYACANYIEKPGFSAPDNWTMLGGRYFIQGPNNEINDQICDPRVVRRQELMEAVRIGNYEDEQSRFESYFGWRTEQEALEFYENHRGSRPENLVMVECESYSIKDMNLVEFNGFGQGVHNSELYWRGEHGSDPPEWEVLMEPPVTVTEVIRTLGN